MNELLCKVHYHFENVPKFMRGFMSREFMRNREIMAAIFNEHIDEINEAWDVTGEPAVLGEWDDDLNPHYGKLIKDMLAKSFANANRNFRLIKYDIDESNGDIIGYVPWLKDSKIWITLELLGEEES